MMFYYTTYDISSGQIIANVMCSIANGASSVSEPTQSQMAGTFDPSTTYISSASGTPTATARPAMSITVDTTSISANGTACCTFSNVPSGAMLAIDGGAPQVCPTPAKFAASDAGTYTLDFSCFPYLDQTFSVVAS